MNCNQIEIDDDDRKSHLYVCAAFQGKRWAAQMIFYADKRMKEYFLQQVKARVIS